MAKKLMVSPITNTIYLTNVKPVGDKPGLFETKGEKQDYTDEAIRAVFQWFMNNCEKDSGNTGYEIRFENCPYVLRMTKEQPENEENS